MSKADRLLLDEIDRKLRTELGCSAVANDGQDWMLTPRQGSTVKKRHTACLGA